MYNVVKHVLQNTFLYVINTTAYHVGLYYYSSLSTKERPAYAIAKTWNVSDEIWNSSEACVWVERLLCALGSDNR